MKIMTAMYTLKKGGSYERFLMMVEAFLEKKCEVHCLSLTPVRIKNPNYRNHIAGLPFGIRNDWIAKFIVVLLFPLHSFFIGWREKINLFIAFGSLYAFLMAIPKWVLKKPMVTLIRGDSTFGLVIQNSPRYILRLNKIMEYLGLIFSDRIITNNTAVQKQIHRIMRSRKKVEIELLFNSIPPIPDFKPEDSCQIRAQFGIPMEAKVLVTAGILNRGKNIEMLIRCLPEIGMKNLFLFIVGDGSTKGDFHYKKYLRELTETIGLTNRVIFTGWLNKEELWKIFRGSDLFVLTSKSEGMPNILLEALGCDIPCFGSDIPGIRDILSYEMLMFPLFEGETLTRKIRLFLIDPSFSDKISQLCHERKKKFFFDWKKAAFDSITKMPTIVIEKLRKGLDEGDPLCC